MPAYRVEVFYKTKRERICLGMEIDAFDPDEAEEIAIAQHIKPYPARQLVEVHVSANGTTCVSFPLGATP